MTATHRITLRQALNDDQLLGAELRGKSWKPWRALLLAAMGETLTDDERVTFKELTQRDHEPNQRVEEMVVVKGRRAGGSSATGKVLIPYLAGLCEHPTLAPGERGILLCVAADQRQADVILDYAEAAFRSSPILSQLIESRTARELRLTNNIIVEVRAADFKRLRGLTFIGCIADEMAFWEVSEESANPDSAILDAIRPGLATTGGPLFLISSPYARRGELWRTYKQHFGPNGDPAILVAQGSTKTFNSAMPQSRIDRAYERDPISADAEWGGNFRRDLEEFVSMEAVNACVEPGVFERPREFYKVAHGFTDPSGGAGDSFSLAIGWKDLATKQFVLACVREFKPPFSPEAICGEIAVTCKAYGVTKLIGDRYAGEWPKQAFSKHGIFYEQSAKPKSDLYVDLLAAINSRRVALLDNARLVSQLLGLERRTARSGKDSIDHAPGGHDDVANAVAGLVSACLSRHGGYTLEPFSMSYVDPDSAAAQQAPPEPVGPVRANQFWWQSQQRAQPTNSADQQRYDGYTAIENAIRYGS